MAVSLESPIANNAAIAFVGGGNMARSLVGALSRHGSGPARLAVAGPLGALVRRGKYRPDPGAILELGRRLATAAMGRLPSVSCATHVPVPPSRRLTRGFDQSALLAAEVARRLHTPHLSLLRRVRSEEQAGRSHRERIEGARGAFRLRLDAAPPPTVLLVDDVMTTGATAAACADELLAGGAECVILLAVAGGPV